MRAAFDLYFEGGEEGEGMTVVSIQTEKPRRHVASGVMLEENNCLSSCHRLRSGEAAKSSRANEVWMFQVHHNHEPKSVSDPILIILDHLSSSQVAEKFSFSWVIIVVRSLVDMEVLRHDAWFSQG